MVIRLNMIGDDDNGDKVLHRRTNSKKDSRNTRAEFKRLKTILPSIRRKENVSKLDIILEAIKYIDDLTEQLEHRLEEGDEDASETSENVVGLADSPSEMQREAAAVMALAAEAQMTSTASGFYSDESPGENSIRKHLMNKQLPRRGHACPQGVSCVLRAGLG